MSGIYIHIPFCKQACAYCDFHFSTSLKNKEAFISALKQEVSLRLNYLPDKKIETLYFGGGTPSILNYEDLAEITDHIAQQYDLSNNLEFTLECNPDDLNDRKLQDLKRLGVNRLSIGLQSFNHEELRWMNRAHDASESESSVKRSQDKGFENITIDLIYGSKFQTLMDWKETLKKTISLQVPHISAYNLTIENKTKLGHDYSKKKEPAIDDEKSSEFFMEMIEVLENHQFIHYEISNFGKENFFSRHNSNYWKGIPYIGFGPSAHSFDGNNRQWNIANNPLYIKYILENQSSWFEKEILSAYERYNEYILISLRTMWGVDSKYIREKFGDKTYFHFLKHIRSYIEHKQIIEKDDIFTLTKEGKLFADRIASDLFITL